MFYIQDENGKLLHNNLKKHTFARKFKNARSYDKIEDAEAYAKYCNEMFDSNYCVRPTGDNDANENK